MCVQVIFSDGSKDVLITNQEVINGTLVQVYKGKSEADSNRKVVIIPRDDGQPDTIVFNGHEKTCGCSRFSLELSHILRRADCLNDAPHPDKGGKEDELERSRIVRDYIPTERIGDRTLEEIAADPRELDTNSYTLKVAVYYDDMFDEEFGGAAVTRVAAIMAIVDEMYSEKDTLKTEIKVETVAIEHAAKENWGTKSWESEVLCTTCPAATIATASPHEANLYVFLTGKRSKDGLGLAWKSAVCDRARTRRVSINKYATGSTKGGDAYTAETVAHEIGHNLGLDHDCKSDNCNHWDNSYEGPREMNGIECYGYMDYNDTTNYWSACSVDDLTNYINQQPEFCLPKLSEAITTTNATTTTTTNTTDVCKTLTIDTFEYGHENKWTLGSKCFGPASGSQYEPDQTITYECCLPAGQHDLNCINSEEDYYGGWNGGSIEIGEMKYCEDFESGANQTQTITWEA